MVYAETRRAGIVIKRSPKADIHCAQNLNAEGSIAMFDSHRWLLPAYAQRFRGRACEDTAHIFLHIPKTAGLTLNTALEQAYAGQRMFSIYGPKWRRSVALFRSFPQSARDRFKLVYGHQMFGLHREFTKPALYFSMLREPVARLVSFFRFAQTDPTINRKLEGHITPERLFLSGGLPVGGDNTMTRFLAGDATIDKVPPGRCTQTLFDVAAENLERAVVVGLVEEFDRSLNLFAAILDWPAIPAATTVNVSTRGDPHAIREEIKTRFPQLYAFDSRLFALAKAKFEREAVARGI